ncbi:MAG: hypothetical protein KAS72_14370 [Phycisphaerales bacterium]|nr:hypothetical protein [Phycisphaerales bacterium]
MMTRRSLPNRCCVVLCLLAGAGACVLTGCAQEREPLTRHEQVLADLTPELRTLHERDADVANQLAHTDNTNTRAFYWDVGRALYTDRPSRLHPGPRPY